jgi:hypothetical protein
MTDIRIQERVTMSFGTQAYNALNHPNFDNPVADVSNPLFRTSVAEGGVSDRPARRVRAWYGRFSALRGDQGVIILRFLPSGSGAAAPALNQTTHAGH